MTPESVNGRDLSGVLGVGLSITTLVAVTIAKAGHPVLGGGIGTLVLALVAAVLTLTDVEVSYNG